MTRLEYRMEAIQALRTAVPYIRLYKEKPFVIKVGGAVLAERQRTRSLCEQIEILQQLRIRVLVVHGGGPQANELLGRLGHEPVFVNGRRVTSAEALEVAKMVYAGTIRTDLLSGLRECGVRAVGLSGVDGELVRARKRPVEEVDYGWVGDILSVDPDVLQRLLDGGYVPVVTPLASDSQGQVLNVNADTMAARIAVAVGAEKLLVLTNAPGLLRDGSDPGSLVSYTDRAECLRLMEEGVVSAGMQPKLEACLDALEGGVPKVHILDGGREDSILAEVFTNEGVGTLIVRDREAIEAAGGAGSWP